MENCILLDIIKWKKQTLLRSPTYDLHIGFKLSRKSVLLQNVFQVEWKICFYDWQHSVCSILHVMCLNLIIYLYNCSCYWCRLSELRNQYLLTKSCNNVDKRTVIKNIVYWSVLTRRTHELNILNTIALLLRYNTWYGSICYLINNLKKKPIVLFTKMSFICMCVIL